MAECLSPNQGLREVRNEEGSWRKTQLCLDWELLRP